MGPRVVDDTVVTAVAGRVVFAVVLGALVVFVPQGVVVFGADAVVIGTAAVVFEPVVVVVGGGAGVVAAVR